jgi:hypothetical protein
MKTNRKKYFFIRLKKKNFFFVKVECLVTETILKKERFRENERNECDGEMQLKKYETKENRIILSVEEDRQRNKYETLAEMLIALRKNVK